MDFEDISEMMRAILSYVKEYPERAIVSADSPVDLLYGFTTMDPDPFLLNKPTWRIKCKDFRSSVSKLPERARDVLIDHFQTVWGRQVIANLLTRGFSPLEKSSSV